MQMELYNYINELLNSILLTVPAHLAVADILYSQGDTKTAAVHYQRAIEQDPTLKDHIFKPLEPYYVGIMSAEEARQHLEKNYVNIT